MLTVAPAKDSVRLDPSSSAPVAKRSVSMFFKIYAILSYRLFTFTLALVIYTTLCLCDHVLCVCVCQEGGFERQSAEPVDHFDGEYPKERIIGTCNMCKKTDVLVGRVCPHLLYSPPLSLSPSLPLSPTSVSNVWPARKGTRPSSGRSGTTSTIFPA